MHKIESSYNERGWIARWAIWPYETVETIYPEDGPPRTWIRNVLPFAAISDPYSEAKVWDAWERLVAVCHPVPDAEVPDVPDWTECPEFMMARNGVWHRMTWQGGPNWPGPLTVRFCDGENLIDLQTIEMSFGSRD